MSWRIKQVDKLVAYSTLSGVLMTWLLLVGLDAARAFISEATDIGQGNYGLGAVTLHILLTLPRRLLRTLFGRLLHGAASFRLA